MDNIESKIIQIADKLSNDQEIVGIVSKPGAGKTTFMMRTINELCLHRGKYALVMSLEMSENQWKEHMKQQGISNKGITICDKTPITIERIEELICMHTCDVVAIDYLQLLELGVVLSDLKKLLQQKGVSAIITSQMASRTPRFCEVEYKTKYPLFDSLIYLDER